MAGTSESKGEADSTGELTIRSACARAGVDVGEQHQPCAACLGGLGHVLGLALVAAIVEQDQQVLAAES